VRLRFAEADNQFYFNSSVDNVHLHPGGKPMPLFPCRVGGIP
jgi:hypothetical protein